MGHVIRGQNADEAKEVKQIQPWKAPLSFLQRVHRGLAWRVAFDTEMIVFRVDPSLVPGAPLDSLRFLHLTSATCPGADQMRAWVPYPESGSPFDLRIAHGDEVLALSDGQTVVCSGWFTTHDRMVGVHKGREFSYRGFFYDFNTRAEWRGRGLYPSLLVQMRYVFGRRGLTEFIIEADGRNHASLRGIVKAGFHEVARTSFRTYFRRWRRPLARSMSDPRLARDDLWSE